MALGAPANRRDIGELAADLLRGQLDISIRGSASEVRNDGIRVTIKGDSLHRSKV